MTEDVGSWIESQRAALARRAWAFAEREDIKRSLVLLEPTALRTLLGAALDASCLLEIQMLLRYQQGRDKGKWAAIVPGLETELNEAVKAAPWDKLPAEARDAAEVQIAVVYIGFIVMLHRYYKAALDEGGGRGPRQADQPRQGEARGGYRDGARDRRR